MAGEEVRVRGILTHWNDAKGFGFITPDGGGARTFAHVSDFGTGSHRPRVGDEVSYFESVGRDGRPSAVLVKRLNGGRPVGVVRPPGRRARPPIVDFAVVAVFIAGYLWVDSMWPLPLWVHILYLTASALSVVLYAIDKRAALRHRHRTSERTLLVIGLIGGWPGAIVAQQLLRHKTVKPSFRLAFWATVVINVVIFTLVATPAGPQLVDFVNELDLSK